MGQRRLFLFTLQTFRRLLISYAVLFVLPLVVSFLVYSGAISAIKGEIDRANKSSLYQMQRLVDARVKELFAVADQISINGEVRSAIAIGREISPRQRLEMRSAQGFLTQCGLANSLLDGVYLYLPQSDYVLSDTGRFRADEFDTVARERFGLSKEEWLKRASAPRFRSISLLPGAGGSDGMVVVAQKILFEGSGESPAVIVLKVKASSFAEILRTLSWDDSARLSIVAEEGSISSSAEAHGSPEWLSFERIGPEYRSSTARRGQDYHIASIGSGTCDWRYLCSIPVAQYLRSVDYVKRLMLIYVVACLLGGAALSYALAKREYTPIRRMTSLFLDRLDGAVPGGGNEYTYLENALQRLLDKNSSLEELLHQQGAALRNSLLSRLLRADLAHPDVLIASCESCGARFFVPGDCLLLAIVVCEGLERIEPRQDSDAMDLVRYMLQPAIDEALGAQAFGNVFEHEGMTLCLVSMTPSSARQDEGRQDAEEGVAEAARRVQALFASRFDLILSIAVSGLYDSFTALPLAFADVSRMADSIVFYERRGVVLSRSEMRAADASIPPQAGLALRKRILQAAGEEDYAAAKSDVLAYLDSQCAEGTLEFDEARIRVLMLLYDILDLVLGDGEEPRLAAGLDPMKAVREARSVTDLRREAERILDAIVAQSPSRPRPGRTLKDEVVRYVEENYRDPNLSVNGVADHFDLSLAYLSRTFKKATGVGLLDYIHIVRVREAKRLMKEGGLGVQEVAKRVGCGSRITLARAFKRFEGIVPSAFQEADSRSKNGLGG
jgi:AraC-type DNA-binding domain-containing proteins